MSCARQSRTTSLSYSRLRFLWQSSSIGHIPPRYDPKSLSSPFLLTVQFVQLKLEESQSNITKTQELENQIKEKNLLIGKLRHESVYRLHLLILSSLPGMLCIAVIINEHLVEALRRLRKSSSETNVDRRLVTNVLLSFLNTPRGDTKRFEMLNLLASILGWTDQEKEKAGIQKAGGLVTSPSSGFWGRSLSSGSPSPSMRNAEVDKTDETEV